MKEEEHGDAITGLQQKTKFGRPNWDEVFSEIARQQHGYLFTLVALSVALVALSVIVYRQ